MDQRERRLLCWLGQGRMTSLTTDSCPYPWLRHYSTREQTRPGALLMAAAGSRAVRHTEDYHGREASSRGRELAVRYRVLSPPQYWRISLGPLLRADRAGNDSV